MAGNSVFHLSGNHLNNLTVAVLNESQHVLSEVVQLDAKPAPTAGVVRGIVPLVIHPRFASDFYRTTMISHSAKAEKISPFKLYPLFSSGTGWATLFWSNWKLLSVGSVMAKLPSYTGE
jgi:hypothetical protein